MFSKEQMKRLQEMGAEYHFTTITLSQFKRGTPLSYDNEIADMYDKATNTKIDRNWSCKSCAYHSYKKIADLYFESKKYYAKKEKEKEEKEAEKEITDFVEDIIDTQEKLKTKKKTTNKKKTTKKK